MRFSKHHFANSLRVRTLDRILSSGVRKQLLLLAIFALFVLGCLFVAAKLHQFKSTDFFPQDTATKKGQNEPAEEIPLLLTVYYHFADSGSQHLATPEARKFTMLISFLGSIILTGLVISTLSNIIERRVDKYKKGLIRYRFNDHIILFGYNDMTPHLIKQLCCNEKYNNPTIVIQTSRTVEEIRMVLNSELTPQERANIVFVYARRDMIDELKCLRVHKAKEVFILGESYLENKAEYAHDSLNMDCLELIGKICQEKRYRRKDRLKCNVSFEYQTTFSAFQFCDLEKNLKKVIEFYPFNFYENWAQKVFVAGETSDKRVKYLPLDREQIDENSDKRVHLVIVGMSKMGIAMGIEAAHVAHYPNFKTKNKKTKITFIDLDADQEMNYVKARYKNLFDLTHSWYTDVENNTHKFSPPSEPYKYLGEDFIDIEWEFIKGNIADAKIQNMISKWAYEKSDLLTIAICFNYSHTSISCALYLPEIVIDKDIPVLILQRDSYAVINNIAGLSREPDDQAKLRYKNFRPFGMEKDCFDVNASNLVHAKRIKYVYDYYYEMTIDPVQIPDLDELYKGWYEEKVANMWSNRYNADSIPTKLRSIGYTKEQWKDIVFLTDKEISILSEVEHNRWNVEKLLVGFRPPTAIEEGIISANIEKEKDIHKAKFIHYDIRPYDQLKIDGNGHNANEYDICLTKALPLIIKE